MSPKSVSVLCVCLLLLLLAIQRWLSQRLVVVYTKPLPELVLTRREMVNQLLAWLPTYFVKLDKTTFTLSGHKNCRLD